jgi:hypothetical protein
LVRGSIPAGSKGGSGSQKMRRQPVKRRKKVPQQADRPWGVERKHAFPYSFPLGEEIQSLRMAVAEDVIQWWDWS